MNFITPASIILSLAAGTALAGNVAQNGSAPGLATSTSNGNPAAEYVNAAFDDSTICGPFLPAAPRASGVSLRPAPLRTGYFAAPKFLSPPAQQPAPTVKSLIPDSEAGHFPSDFSSVLPGPAGPNGPVPLPGCNGDDNSPVTVPLPSGVVMGLTGLLSLAAVAKRRSNRSEAI